MRILVVEDEEKLADAISRGLTHKGYAVDTITDGKKGFTRISLHRNDYDLVILDLMLPSMDGATICREVRELEITVPILVLTARNETETKVDLLLSGADDYLVKPFSFSELTARVRALTRRAFSSDYLYAADLKLDATRRTVIRSGKVILLSQKETDVLRILLEAKGQAVTREMMSRDLWNITHTVLDNNIDVAISGLRRKIDQDFKDKLIETVRGVGFRIRE